MYDCVDLLNFKHIIKFPTYTNLSGLGSVSIMYHQKSGTKTLKMTNLGFKPRPTHTTPQHSYKLVIGVILIVLIRSASNMPA